jgi:scyllo-inositol 2-dehydrogenase (NADP+)
MRTIVVGLGRQGAKRRAAAGAEVVATVDPVVVTADYRQIEEVPLDSFDAALVCVPDDAKLEILRYLLTRRKHTLVEKPLLVEREADLTLVQELARENAVACYTAYNHRFEPQIVRLQQVLYAGSIGAIRLARLFYGNGTAFDVKRSPWRDRGMGVLSDLGSHLLDLGLYLFGKAPTTFETWSLNRFENRAFDHVIFACDGSPVVVFEASLVCWRNTFTVDVFGETGSAHVNGLCKWGPSTLTIRNRILPSGRPDERTEAVSGSDPTWTAEYAHFKALCQSAGTNLENDIWINRCLDRVAATPKATS